MITATFFHSVTLDGAPYLQQVGTGLVPEDIGVPHPPVVQGSDGVVYQKLPASDKAPSLRYVKVKPVKVHMTLTQVNADN